MEERDSSAGDGGKDEPPLRSSRYVPLPVVPGSETYVVHFPRDQVYRIPPPENARIVESYRPKNNQKKSCSPNAGRLRILILLVIIALALAISFATILILYKPKSPEFSVMHFHAKKLSSSSKSKHARGRVHQQVPEYSISLQLENTNQRMKVHYGNGTMFLEFRGKEIASGKYSSFVQEAAKKTQVVETLYGAKKAMSSSIEKSLNDKRLKSMSLRIELPVKVTSWIMSSRKNMIVNCNFKVNKIAEKGTKVSSQECRTNF